MPETDLNACDICGLKSSSEINFLLNCCICRRGFHHRCCRPPIPDEVLTSLIKATFKNKPGKGVNYWRCCDCREGNSPAATSSCIVVRPPAAPANFTTSRIPQKRKQDEVIVISDDDDEPRKEIVISSHPPRLRDQRHKARSTFLGAAAHPEAADTPEPHSGPSKTHSPLSEQPPPLDPPTSIYPRLSIAPHSSASRFGLLSPPTSVGGSSIRYPSTTPFFFDFDQEESHRRVSTPQFESHVEPTTEAVKPSDIPPTPPISAQNQLPLVQDAASTASPPKLEPAIAQRKWKSDIVQQNLRILRQEFREQCLAKLGPPRGAVQPQERRPRKPARTAELDIYHRTPCQCSFCHFGIPK